MLHRKTAFTRVFFVHARHFAIDPFSKHNPTKYSSSNRTQQTKNKKLRIEGFKYLCGGLFGKGKCRYQKDIYLFVFKVLEQFTNFNRVDNASQLARGDGAPMDAQYPQLAGHFITNVPFIVCASTLPSTFHWEVQNYPKVRLAGCAPSLLSWAHAHSSNSSFSSPRRFPT